LGDDRAAAVTDNDVPWQGLPFCRRQFLQIEMTLSTRLGLKLNSCARRLLKWCWYGARYRALLSPVDTPAFQGRRSMTIDPLVQSEFDPQYYRTTYRDLSHLDDAQAYKHFLSFGAAEGRSPSAAAARETFVQLVPNDDLALEIGPFGNPQLAGAHVRYADILSTEELRLRALDHGVDPSKCPPIHYVLADTPLERITDRFRSVFSCHCIEHQPDLIGHLQAVANLLKDGNNYYVIVPDKRYCFDHYQPESTIAEVLAAYEERRQRHTLRAWLAACTLVTHNDSSRHWKGEHGSRAMDQAGSAAVRSALDEFRAASARGAYLDCHAWQFTPASFRDIIQLIRKLGLSSFEAVTVCETLRSRNEFCAILRKVGDDSPFALS
jgi:SAM-dependent methyltransferase